jgi:hypothetical protein
MTNSDPKTVAGEVCLECDHGVYVTGYYGGEFDDGSHACEECIAAAFQAEREMSARILEWMAARAVAEVNEYGTIFKRGAKKAVLETAEVMRACAEAVRSGRQDIRDSIKKAEGNE